MTFATIKIDVTIVEMRTIVTVKTYLWVKRTRKSKRKL